MTIARRSARAAALSLAALALAGLPLAQETAPPKQAEPEEEELPEIVIPDLTGMQDGQREMIRLFHEVERTLEAIDVELFDAGAGRIPPPEGKDSGIERLLRSHGEKSDQAVSGIERILEIAQQMGGQSGGT